MMKILGALLMLIGALYHQVCWMPAVSAAGLILLALAVERSISAKLDAIQEELRDQEVSTAISEHTAGQPGPSGSDNGKRLQGG